MKSIFLTITFSSINKESKSINKNEINLKKKILLKFL